MKRRESEAESAALRATIAQKTAGAARRLAERASESSSLVGDQTTRLEAALEDQMTWHGEQMLVIKDPAATREDRLRAAASIRDGVSRFRRGVEGFMTREQIARYEELDAKASPLRAPSWLDEFEAGLR